MTRYFEWTEGTIEEREDVLRSFARLLADAGRIAFLTGAGISTESGLPDFRSADGVYSETSESLFSLEGFLENLDSFYARFAPFYRRLCESKPNAGHLAIARLEREFGKKVDVVTQNIDELHSRAGSTRVSEIHGTLGAARCLRCDKVYESASFRESAASGTTPRCEACGGVLKPEIVFYGEELPLQALNAAYRSMWEARLLVVAGTSLQVYPAAGLPRECDAGVPFVVVNKTPTPLDSQATLVFRGSCGEIFSGALEYLPEALERESLGNF